MEDQKLDTWFWNIYCHSLILVTPCSMVPLQFWKPRSWTRPGIHFRIHKSPQLDFTVEAQLNGDSSYSQKYL